jgi:hypothetical protein
MKAGDKVNYQFADIVFNCTVIRRRCNEIKVTGMTGWKDKTIFREGWVTTIKETN